MEEARTIKGMLIDVQNETARVVEVEDKLDSYYELLQCDCIDIVERKVGRRTYSIVIDDEGLFRQPKISAISDLGDVMLVGNLLIVRRDGESLASITNDDIKYLKGRIIEQSTRMYPKGYPMLMQCGYAY